MSRRNQIYSILGLNLFSLYILFWVIYFSLFFPLFHFPVPSLISRVRIQRRTARFVLNYHKKTSSVTNMLNNLKWPSLEKRRKATRLTNLYKINNHKIKVQCKELEPAPTRSRRAHDQQLRRLQCKKDIRQNSFFPRTIKEWNELKQEAVSAPSADAFRRHVLWSYC